MNELNDNLTWGLIARAEAEAEVAFCRDQIERAKLGKVVFKTRDPEGTLEHRRMQVEQAERWKSWINRIPYLSFKPDWEVKIIPPFLGAMTRFQVRKGTAWVSVYLDVYTRLSGSVGEDHWPHWEVHPSGEWGADRFDMDDVEALIAAIDSSLEEQLRAAVESEAV